MPTAVCTATRVHRPRAAPTPTARSRPPTATAAERRGHERRRHVRRPRAQILAWLQELRAVRRHVLVDDVRRLGGRRARRARRRRGGALHRPETRPRHRRLERRRLPCMNWRPIRGRPPDLCRTRPWGRRSRLQSAAALPRALFRRVGLNDHTIPPLQNPGAAGTPATRRPRSTLSGAAREWLAVEYGAQRDGAGARANGCVPEVTEAPSRSTSIWRRSASRGRDATRRR